MKLHFQTYLRDSPAGQYGITGDTFDITGTTEKFKKIYESLEIFWIKSPMWNKGKKNDP